MVVECTDNCGACTDDAKQTAVECGYIHIREDCRIRRKHKGGSIPLKTFWHAGRKDNQTACHPDTLEQAEKDGYTFIRTEGYVFPSDDQESSSD